MAESTAYDSCLVRVIASLYMIMNQLFSRAGDLAGVLGREVSPPGQRILANHPRRVGRWASGLPTRDAMTAGCMTDASVTYHRQDDYQGTLTTSKQSTPGTITFGWGIWPHH